MIDRLENCPNCGGILNEDGRCKFCGSKVYDFLNISFSDPHSYSDKTYIRIKINGKIMIAPVVVRDCSITMKTDNILCNEVYNENCFMIKQIPATELDLGLLVIGDVVSVDDKEME